MIFKSVNELNNKTEKKFFLEYISIYIRLVEVYCEKHNIELNNYSTTNTNIPKLIEIGVINHETLINTLEKQLGELYPRFIQAVNCAVDNDNGLKDILSKLNNTLRLEKQKENKSKTQYSLVDFFCGAGGLSLGFLQNGFNVKLANDIEDVCIATYKYNHPELPSENLVQGDIKDIVDNINKYINQPIDVVIGGPPCQGFSEANRQRIIDDPRNKLYKYFVAAVEKIAPKFVVMENVKGMLKVADQVVEDYKKIKLDNNRSYIVSYRVLNSKNFSVAQRRERLIYIAIRSDIAEEKQISPDDIFNEIENQCSTNPLYVLEHVLSDIKEVETLRTTKMNDVDTEKHGKKIDVNYFENHNNPYLNLINCNRKTPYVFNHKARYCNDLNYEIYGRLNPGDDSTDEKIKDIMPYANRNDCFKDKYFKLRPDMPSKTVIAHLKVDGNSFIHPYQTRSLTPRETARIQSFPDDYLFLGAFLKTYMQIGNAVPPLMARGISKVIKKYL